MTRRTFPFFTAPSQVSSPEISLPALAASPRKVYILLSVILLPVISLHLLLERGIYRIIHLRFESPFQLFPLAGTPQAFDVPADIRAPAGFLARGVDAYRAF